MSRAKLFETTATALYLWPKSRVYEIEGLASGKAYLRSDEAVSIAREILRAEGWSIGRLVQVGKKEIPAHGEG